MKAKQVKQTRNAKAYRKAGSQAMVKKAEEQFRALGRNIVAVAIRAENTVRDTLISLKGNLPQEIELVKDGIRTAWTEHRLALFAGKPEDATEVTVKMMLQATYNRQSEQLAVCNAFKAYAGMDDVLRAEFDSEILECQGYHKLVEFARHVNRAGKGEPLTVQEVAKKKREMKELRANTFKAIERNLKLASVEQLQQLALDIQARLHTLKAPAAPTLALVKAKKTRAISETRAMLKTPKAKQRKAA